MASKTLTKMPLHHELGQWLLRFKLLGPESPALEADASVEALVDVIRDGVVLCQVCLQSEHVFTGACVKCVLFGPNLTCSLIALSTHTV